MVLVDPKNQILQAVKNHYVIKTFYYVRMQSGVLWWPGSLFGDFLVGCVLEVFYVFPGVVLVGPKKSNSEGC